MSPSITSYYGHRYSSSLIPPFPRPDVVDSVSLQELILNALGASIGIAPQTTFNYRLRGTDTLTWGDQNPWIEIKGIRGLLSLRDPLFLRKEDPDEEFIETRAIKYGALLDAVESHRFRRLEEIYSFRDAEAVRRFLHAYPQLVEVLLEAHVYLQKYFGPDPRVTLEVVSDPEVEGMDELFAYIVTTLSVDEALARLDRLDEEWFLDQIDRVDGRFNFNLEFV